MDEELALVTPISGQPPVVLENNELSQGHVDDAVASPEVRRPPVAVRTSAFVMDLGRLPKDSIVTANRRLIDDFLVPAAGVVTVQGVVTGTTTVFTVCVANPDDSDQYFPLNGGANITIGTWFKDSVQVVRGDLVNVSVKDNTTIGPFRVVYSDG